MELKSGEFSVPFGIVNISGLMGSANNVVSNPLFSHESYTITTTLDSSVNNRFGIISCKTSEDGKNYKKFFRKNVRWNFGDGTEIDGQTATHSYKFPGRYTITCYFFDIDRKGYKNSYTLDVIVKQAIPTKMEFVVNESAITSIPCSSTEQIARLDVRLSNLISEDLKINPQRIVEKGEKQKPNWDDVKACDKPQFQNYYSFLTYESALSGDVLVPCQKYTVDYETIYGCFYNDNNKINLKLFRVTPFKNAEQLPNIIVNDPNTSILTQLKEPEISVPIINVSSISELPPECTFIGKRGFVDIFYRSDFVTTEEALSFSFDIDKINITDSTIPSSNFLNMPPLGLTLAVLKNAERDIRYSLTFNGFCNDYKDIDEGVEQSFIKGYCFTCFVTPYVLNKLCGYYIPKDHSLYETSASVVYRGDNDSLVKITKNTDYSFLLNVKFELHTVLEAEIIFPDFKIYLYKTLIDMDSVTVPKEHMYKQDTNELIRAYFPHSLFYEKTEFKQLFKNLLGNKNFLNYVVTRGCNFVDDFSNPHTIYTSQLLNFLKMMGQNVSEYEITNFDGINDLRDLCRILSMNYSRIFGHAVKDKNGIKVNEIEKGENVGDQIYVTDKLYVYLENNGKDLLKGKVFKIERDNVLLNVDYPTTIIISDDYAKFSKVVSFSGIDAKSVQTDKDGKKYAIFQIKDYDKSWGWNLLLPGNYNKDKQGETINSYYSFYLFRESDKLTRFGNYADENTITPDMDYSNWNSGLNMAGLLLRDVLLNTSGALSPENNIVTEIPTPPSELDRDNEIQFILTISGNLTISLIKQITTWNLRTTQYCDFWLDWGDGTPEVRVSERLLLESQDMLRHTYGSAGTYIVKISRGVCRWWLPENSKLTGEDGVFQDSLTEIRIPAGKFSPIAQTDGGFTNCQKLQTIPANLFGKIVSSNNNENNVRYAFSKTTKLRTLPSGLLGVDKSYFGANVDFTGMFANSETIQTIPAGFFSAVAKEQPLEGQERKFIFTEMFNLCTLLLSMPDNILDGFQDNGEMTITRMFRGCSSLNQLPPIWEKFYQNTPHYNCFCACYSAKNYSKMPSGWGCV